MSAATAPAAGLRVDRTGGPLGLVRGRPKRECLPKGGARAPCGLCQRRRRSGVALAGPSGRTSGDAKLDSRVVVESEGAGVAHVPPPRAESFGRLFGFLSFAGALAVASVAGVVVGARYITLVPQYSESARARAKRLNKAERNSNRKWDWAVDQNAKGSETVEWLNAALRKVWRVYMKQIERWIERRLQRAIDGAVLRRKIKQRKESEEGDFAPLFNLNSVKLVELKLDFQPPVIRAIESRSESRRDSEIGAIANVRYTGGMRALFMIEVSISLQDEKGDGMDEWQQRMWRGYMSMEDEDKGVSSALAPLSLSRPWQIRIPVQVYDLDIESDLWVRARLAPLAPYIGRLSLAFVDSPAVGVQLAPYKRAQLMRIPIIQSFLTKLITEDLPNLMILPRKLNFEIPPSLAAVAGAAIGEDIVKKAILNAVLRSNEDGGLDIPEEKLEETMNELMDQSKTQGEREAQSKTQNIIDEMVKPMKSAGAVEDLATDKEATEQLQALVKPWTQGGITLPQVFQGELLVTKGGIPLYDESRPQTEPSWNQEFQFLVQDASKDELLIQVRDGEFMGKADLGYATLRVADLEAGVQTPVWLTLQPPPNTPGVIARVASAGEIFIEATYRAFQDEEGEGSAGAGLGAGTLLDQPSPDLTAAENGDQAITDMRSAAEASTKAGIRSSMTARALAITKAASVRASLALRSRFNQEKKTVSAEIVTDQEGAPGEGADLGEVSESRMQKMIEVLQERFERDEVTSEKRAARWIARSDRPWFQLVSFLLGTVVVLLVLIAYRLDIAINFQP
ncbi:hypothetical protein HKI87_01g04960 [Chloropicon roscoffensis]|uniref:SMP-LTD domain-containing protein n=1 Tax=Chloropicon roscoffensis TaxID=1461544 RepID=A0AAX4NZ18_9CHLO